MASANSRVDYIVEDAAALEGSVTDAEKQVKEGTEDFELAQSEKKRLVGLCNKSKDPCDWMEKELVDLLSERETTDTMLYYLVGMK